MWLPHIICAELVNLNTEDLGDVSEHQGHRAGSTETLLHLWVE